MQTIKYRFLMTFMLLASAVFGSPATVFAQGDVHVQVTQVDNSKFPNVTVYVSVTNAAGEPVGVDPSTIQISENGTLMQPTDIRGGGQGQAAPLTTMLVIDISGSMDKNNKLRAAKDAAKTYVSQMRPGDQAGLMTFDTKSYYPQPVTNDLAALTNAIEGLRSGSDTAMFDALTEAEKALDPVSGRKSIIVMTDGLDNRSHAKADDVIKQIGPSGLTISTIGFGDASTASQSGLDEGALKSLAEKSGGLYSYASDADALSKLYQQYGLSMQSEYAITYVSPLTLRDGVNRSLNVSLSTAGVSAQTNYNPGGVLPEVGSKSWTLFAGILGGLILLLFIPFLVGLVGRGAGLFSGSGIGGVSKRKGRIKMSQPAPAGKRPNIKIK